MFAFFWLFGLNFAIFSGACPLPPPPAIPLQACLLPVVVRTDCCFSCCVTDTQLPRPVCSHLCYDCAQNWDLLLVEAGYAEESTEGMDGSADDGACTSVSLDTVLESNDFSILWADFWLILMFCVIKRYCLYWNMSTLQKTWGVRSGSFTKYLYGIEGMTLKYMWPRFWWPVFRCFKKSLSFHKFVSHN